MCGIAGFLLFGTDAPFDPGVALQKMIQSLGHRGPDDHGVYQKGSLYLAHARLSIIDVAGGQQPLLLNEGDLIIGNGEIYNYVELKQQLDLRSYKTNSDFEPALQACVEGGVDKGLSQWRGMYSTALRLASSEDLILARDPFGIKPLYYSVTREYFAFASEPRALIAAGLATPELDKSVVLTTLNYNYSPFTNTVYKNIRRLHPGEIIRISPQGYFEQKILQEITKPPKQSVKLLSQDPDEALKRFDQVLENSVYVHQRSDVPYGLFLSGGIDSCSLLTMMARLNEKPVKTFTCGFDSDSVHDERNTARRVADFYKTEHFETTFTYEDFIMLLPQVVWALDDPTCDPAVLPTYKLASLAKNHIKVVLSGEGGDEVFGGYGRYRKYCRPWIFGGKRLPLNKNLPFLKAKEEWRDHVAEFNTSFSQQDCSDPLQKIQAYDIKMWLPADLLLKLDRCLMAHSLEGRTPYLDTEVFNFGFYLPPSLKIRKKYGKWLVRQWLQQNCPVADAFGRKKGFAVPVVDWITRSHKDFQTLLLRHSALRLLMDLEQLERAVSHPSSLWPLLFYATWYNVHIQGVDFSQDIWQVLQ